MSTETERLGRIDGCPECLNTEPPYDAVPDRWGYVAYYRCHDCGLTWNTGWGDD